MVIPMALLPTIVPDPSRDPYTSTHTYTLYTIKYYPENLTPQVTECCSRDYLETRVFCDLHAVSHLH